MNKVFYRMMTVLLLCTVTFISCSKGKTDDTVNESDSSSQYEGKELTLWLPPFGSDPAGVMDLELWKGVTDGFGERLGVTVNLEIIPWSGYNEKYLTAISSGNGPDVGYMYLEMLGNYIDMGAIAPLDEFVTAGQRDLYYYLDKGKILGKQYTFPFVVGNPKVLYYNKTILAEQGITDLPATWESFIDICSKIKSDTDGDGQIDIYPFIQAWNEPSIGGLNSNYYPYVWQAGGEIFDEEGKFALNSPEGLKAAQFIYDMRFKHDILDESVLSLSDYEVGNMFVEGKVAFAVLQAKMTSQLEDAGLDWGYIPSLKDVQMGTFSAMDSLVIINSCEDKKLAYELILELTKAESMKKFHEMAPFPPITKDGIYLDNESFKPLYSDYADIFNTLPVAVGSSEVFDFLQKNLQLMVLGERSPQEALDAVEEYSRSVLQ